MNRKAHAVILFVHSVSFPRDFGDLLTPPLAALLFRIRVRFRVANFAMPSFVMDLRE